jgi:hypothetical protein
MRFVIQCSHSQVRQLYQVKQMKKITQITRLKDTLNKIASLTKSANFELQKRDASEKCYNYTTTKKTAITSDFIRVYTPTINAPLADNTFAIVIDNDLLSITIKDKDSDLIQGTIPMEFEPFRDLLKSFLKKLSADPKSWTQLFHQHFLTPELDDTKQRKAKREDYTRKQIELVSQYEKMSITTKESRNELDNAEAEAIKQKESTQEHKDVIELRNKLSAAIEASINKAKQISESLDIPNKVLKQEDLERQLNDLDSKINWELALERSDEKLNKK